MKYTLKAKFSVSIEHVSKFLLVHTIGYHKYENSVMSITYYAPAPACVSLLESLQRCDYAELLTATIVKGDK